MPINVAAFKGSEKVTVNRGLDKKPFPKLGDYLMRLDNFHCVQDRKGIDVMVAEFTTVHIFDSVEGKPSHAIGEELNKVTKQTNDYYVKDIKAIVTACTGCSDAEIGQVEILQAFGYDETGQELPSGRPLDGMYITLRVQTVELEKQDSPGDTFQITNFKSAVAPEDLLNILDDEIIQQFYTDEDGNNVLEAMVQ